MKLVINTDGGSRGNPGISAYSFVIKDSRGIIFHQEAKAFGISTNNIAEYTAVWKALSYVLEFLNKAIPHNILIITDSQLIAEQLSGRYKVKSPNLKLIFQDIKSIEKKIGVVRYKNVPREENFIADKLVNQALDRDLEKDA